MGLSVIGSLRRGQSPRKEYCKDGLGDLFLGMVGGFSHILHQPGGQEIIAEMDNRGGGRPSLEVNGATRAR